MGLHALTLDKVVNQKNTWTNKMKKSAYSIAKAFGVIALSAAAIAMTGASASAQNTVITGNIKGLKDKQIHISYRQGTESKQDSVKVMNGHFTWKLQLAEPQEVYLMFPQMYFPFFAEPGHETVTGLADSSETFKVTGSKTQDESVAYENSLKDLNDQEEPLYKKYGKVSKEEQVELERKLAQINDRIHERGAAYIAAHPSSYYSIHLVSSRASYGTDYAVVKQLYDKLDERAKRTIAGKALAARLDVLKRSAIGSQMMNFTQADTLGSTVPFTAFKGKYVLVDFWASWCGPCRAENPNVLKAYNAYKDKGFTVVGISLDEKGDKWKKAIRDDNMPWAELSDLKGWKNEVSDYFGIQGIPSNLLVDPSGKIVARDLRGEALDQKLNELLK